MANPQPEFDHIAETCVECGTRTDRWVRGWDGKYRCTVHAARGPRPPRVPVPSEYLLEGDQGHIEIIHEPCGEQVLLTLRVHLDTVDRLADKHVCPPGEQA